MFQLLNLFVDICLFRRGPQDVPDVSVLLLMSALAYVGTGLAMVLSDSTLGAGIAQVGIDLGTMVGLVYVLLRMKGLLGRFMKTIIAMCGSGALLNLLALPLVSWAISVGETSPAPSMLLVVLVLWSLSVIGHIFRHTLSVSFPMGLLAGFAYLILSILVTRTFVIQ